MNGLILKEIAAEQTFAASQQIFLSCLFSVEQEAMISLFWQHKLVGSTFKCIDRKTRSKQSLGWFLPFRKVSLSTIFPIWFLVIPQWQSFPHCVYMPHLCISAPTNGILIVFSWALKKATLNTAEWVFMWYMFSCVLSNNHEGNFQVGPISRGHFCCELGIRVYFFSKWLSCCSLAMY